MSRDFRSNAFVSYYSAALSGLLSSANYTMIKSDFDELNYLVSLAKEIAVEAVHYHNQFTQTEISSSKITKGILME